MKTVFLLLSFHQCFCFRHYAVPNMPTIKGMDNFKGKIMHSHQYRHPDEYVDKNVVLFGGLSSGMDISILMTKVAKNVWLSHKGRRILSPMPSNFYDVSVKSCVIATLNHSSV